MIGVEGDHDRLGLQRQSRARCPGQGWAGTAGLGLKKQLLGLQLGKLGQNLGGLRHRRDHQNLAAKSASAIVGMA